MIAQEQAMTALSIKHDMHQCNLQWAGSQIIGQATTQSSQRGSRCWQPT
jgi:hypothetical protein